MNAQEAKDVLRQALSNVIEQLDHEVSVPALCRWLAKFARETARKYRQLEEEALKEQLIELILAA
ncbi:MAG: hypothetical protein QXZ09_08205, partial [Candidatus Methanomethylicaceae archaeon]